MTVKRIRITSVFALSLILMISSCMKDNFEFDKLAQTEWNPSLAAPLVHSSLSIQDILTKNDKSGIISIDSNHFCSIVYEGNLFSIIASDLVKIPDQTIPPYTASLDLSQIPIFVSNQTITLPYTQTVNFTPGTNNPKMDSVVFKAGTIELAVNSDFNFDGEIKIEIPGAKKNGRILSQTMILDYNGIVPVLANAVIDLNGYRFDMTNGSTAVNQFVVNYEVTLRGVGPSPTTSNRVILSGEFKNLKFDKIFGDLGQLPLSLDKDTVDIGIFKNAIGSGTISLADPRLTMVISNSYGIPIDARIAELDAYTPGSIPFQVTGFPTPLPLYSPTKSQIGQTLTGSFTLNNSNSNLATIIKKVPQSFIYKIDSKTNPNGPTHENFILDTSRFKVDMKVELPLYGTAKDFLLIDTVDFKMEENFTDQLESATIRTFNSNGFPMDVAMQVYFADSTYKKLDSLVRPYQLILRSATVNPITGKVTNPNDKIYDVVITPDRVKNLKTAKYLLVKAIATTTSGGNTNVKIYSNYKIDLKLGIQANIKKKF
ncbi:MAG TPA: hypothetical protein VFF27_05525 [Bacteroidia bacterium]|jgi:hypothetical protein|nr:hypothetical protein [Bacteroidia bacterium]